ncbi:ATP-binding protein [Sphingomonas floccifaciens]|uniref:histidine kinase n=1 Tax=Sphingomonas floccifaciens TaxID=1844115 RepID=A0ABW4NAI9_9SPHN
MPSRHAPRWIAPLVVALVVLTVATFAGDRWSRAQATRATDAIALATARGHAALLASELQKFRLLPLVLVEFPDVRAALSGSQPAQARLDARLEQLVARTDAANLYVIDTAGRTVASSNYRAPTSFVGQNYSFRPYFRDAMRRGASELFALGTVSGRPGFYLARRVDEGGRALGVVVVKVEFEAVEAAWARASGASFVVGPQNVVLITSRSDWRFRSIGPVAPAVAAAARRTLQFGAAAPLPAPLVISGSIAVAGGDRYRIGIVPAPIAGARLIHLTPFAPALSSARTLALLWGFGALLCAGVVGAVVVRGAERRRLQREAHARLEQQVAARTADLRDANERLRIESEERVATDRRYRAAREELAQANRLGTLGQITAGVAHEINQPVAAIRTFAENGTILLDRGAEDAARDNLGRIVALADRIGTIKAELRGFARKRTPAGGTATLGDILDGTLILIGERARGRIAVDTDPDTRAVRLVGDRVRIEQILVNLIQNALDAIGETDGRITVSAVREEARMTLTVADTGSGVDPGIRDALFTPFTSGKPAGLGLGLAIARDIAREFGGDLALLPDGPGAHFALTLAVTP